MARRGTTRGCPRGGGSIQASRRSRSRVGTAGLSFATATLLLGWTLLGIDSLPILVIAGAAGAPSVLLLAAGLWGGWPAFVPWAVVSLGASYAVSLHGLDGIDGRAALVGAALVLVAELAYWSLERRTPVGDEAGLHGRRAVSVLALTCAAAALGAALLALTAVPLGGSVAWDALGLAAAAGALATLALLSARRSSA